MDAQKQAWAGSNHCWRPAQCPVPVTYITTLPAALATSLSPMLLTARVEPGRQAQKS